MLNNTIAIAIASYNSDYIIRTRRAQPVSCRLWQLIYCITTLIGTITDMPRISAIINLVKSEPTIHRLIYECSSTYHVTSYSHISQLNFGANFAVIYIKSQQILHYFTIIRTKRGKYYLTSSYVSDYVSVRGYTTLLVMDDFERFIVALRNNTDDYAISFFYKKYFLKGGVPVKECYELDKTKRFKMIEPEEGARREIDVILRNTLRHNIRCGLIPQYEHMIANYCI